MFALEPVGGQRGHGVEPRCPTRGNDAGKQPGRHAAAKSHRHEPNRESDGRLQGTLTRRNLGDDGTCQIPDQTPSAPTMVAAMQASASPHFS